MPLPGIGGIAGRTSPVSSDPFSFTELGLTRVSLTSSYSLSGLSAGDVVVLCDIAVNTDAATAPTSVTPIAFTSLVNISATGGGIGWRMIVSWRKMLGGDFAVTGMNDNKMRKEGFIFRPSRAIVSVTASTWNGEATASNPASQSVSASGQTPPLIVVAFAATMGASTGLFTTQTPSFQVEANGSAGGTTIGLRRAYTIYNEGDTPANHTIDIGDNGDNAFASGYLRFT